MVYWNPQITIVFFIAPVIPTFPLAIFEKKKHPTSPRDETRLATAFIIKFQDGPRLGCPSRPRLGLVRKVGEQEDVCRLDHERDASIYIYTSLSLSLLSIDAHHNFMYLATYPFFYPSIFLIHLPTPSFTFIYLSVHPSIYLSTSYLPKYQSKCSSTFIKSRYLPVKLWPEAPSMDLLWDQNPEKKTHLEIMTGASLTEVWSIWVWSATKFRKKKRTIYILMGI